MSASRQWHQLTPVADGIFGRRTQSQKRAIRWDTDICSFFVFCFVSFAQFCCQSDPSINVTQQVGELFLYHVFSLICYLFFMFTWFVFLLCPFLLLPVNLLHYYSCDLVAKLSFNFAIALTKVLKLVDLKLNILSHCVWMRKFCIFPKQPGKAKVCEKSTFKVYVFPKLYHDFHHHFLDFNKKIAIYFSPGKVGYYYQIIFPIIPFLFGRGSEWKSETFSAPKTFHKYSHIISVFKPPKLNLLENHIIRPKKKVGFR
jgi:hypothetical protein